MPTLCVHGWNRYLALRRKAHAGHRDAWPALSQNEDKKVRTSLSADRRNKRNATFDDGAGHTQTREAIGRNAGKRKRLLLSQNNDDSWSNQKTTKRDRTRCVRRAFTRSPQNQREEQLKERRKMSTHTHRREELANSRTLAKTQRYHRPISLFAGHTQHNGRKATPLASNENKKMQQLRKGRLC